jgi:hypothetical protein
MNFSNVALGKTFVLTGIFPTMGGGSGLDVGKAALTKLIVESGGTVKDSVTKRTDYLVTGVAPGGAKVFKARELKIKCIELDVVKRMCSGGVYSHVHVISKAITAEAFSRGFNGNGVGRKLALLSDTAPTTFMTLKKEH